MSCQFATKKENAGFEKKGACETNVTKQTTSAEQTEFADFQLTDANVFW
jgi:hypothetical protein